MQNQPGGDENGFDGGKKGCDQTVGGQGQIHGEQIAQVGERSAYRKQRNLLFPMMKHEDKKREDYGKEFSGKNTNDRDPGRRSHSQ